MTPIKAIRTIVLDAFKAAEGKPPEEELRILQGAAARLEDLWIPSEELKAVRALAAGAADPLKAVSLLRDCFVGLVDKKKSSKYTAAESKLRSGDLLGVYLEKIGEFPLLTAEEEVALGRKIEDGDEDAKRRFVEANLRLVVWNAKGYENRGVPLLDLIQEGNFGLMEALNPGRWDYRLGPFATYAKSWIRKYIILAVHNQSRVVRSPEDVNEDIERLNKFCSKFLVENGRFPSVEEIASGLFPGNEEQGILRVRLLMRTEKQGGNLSLDLQRTNKGSSIADMLGDDKAQSALSALILQERTEKMNDALQKLDPRDRVVLELHYGLKDGQERTLKEIGEILGVSGSRVGQLEQAALVKLRDFLPKTYSDET